ncbi:uncharacterized protein EI90DRAFT_3127228 [Cantharellus anzutake]|uniref:uncharacterized protein n=1 Tax=Cantharellus anzutake TaxID=1750568 RepID=UPI0019072461|nr:uncharacterized protein EI90DRAFT_3127228 [Cantharellus anzutake]KAF8327192.1 hypothetical protein EI90DRAFT_3127228 [Cantharellus anzutake]
MNIISMVATEALRFALSLYPDFTVTTRRNESEPPLIFFIVEIKAKTTDTAKAVKQLEEYMQDAAERNTTTDVFYGLAAAGFEWQVFECKRRGYGVTRVFGDDDCFSEASSLQFLQLVEAVDSAIDINAFTSSGSAGESVRSSPENPFQRAPTYLHEEATLYHIRGDNLEGRLLRAQAGAGSSSDGSQQDRSDDSPTPAGPQR